MIQRIQTLWLLLATAAAGSMFFLPVYGVKMQDSTFKNFIVSASYPLFILVIALALLPLLTIFLFKKRSLQMKLTWLGILLAILTAFIVYLKAGDFAAHFNAGSSSYKIAAAMPVVTMVFLFLAFRKIRSDEKMVRSVDRLR